VARVIDIISTSTGAHYLEVGIDSNSLSSFGWQLYITKTGRRAVDWVQHLSLGFVSFMGGDLWIHNYDEVPRCNFFGEQKEMKVGVVANENPNLIKILDSIGIHTDGSWDIESVTIAKTPNTPNGMSSFIPTQRFKKREGVLSAEFLRNMKTTSSTSSVIEAIRGETLRGNSAYILLRNTQSSQVKLYKVTINMTTSR
jgi:hypothetical protein